MHLVSGILRTYFTQSEYILKILNFKTGLHTRMGKITPQVLMKKEKIDSVVELQFLITDKMSFFMCFHECFVNYASLSILTQFVYWSMQSVIFMY